MAIALMMDDTGDLRDDLGLSPAETAIAADLRAAFLVEPDRATAERHIAAMVAAREAVRAPSVISLTGHRSRKALAAAGLVGAVVLGSAGVAAASGGLPDPIQRVVASVGRPMGIDLPSPASARRDPAGGPDREPTTVAPSTDPAVPPTTVARGDDVLGSGSGSGDVGETPKADPRTTPETRDDHPKTTPTTPKSEDKSKDQGNDGHGVQPGGGKDNGGGGKGNGGGSGT